MIEILFRGKRIDNGEWAYGIPIKNKLGTYIVFEENPHFCSQYGYMEICEIALVIPETVGQHTGLTDKNGTKIFEDDILQEPDVMHNGQIQVPGEIARVVMDEGCYFVSYEGYAQFLSNVCDKWEVVGNVHDSPELLEVDRDKC